MKAERYHRQAMGLLDNALEAKLLGNEAAERSLVLKAFEAARNAAFCLLDQLDLEPTRAILFRSAASLAARCQDYAEAGRLAHAGLMGFPPPDVREELKEVLQRATFEQYLQAKNISLAQGELHVSMLGSAVGNGIAPSDHFLSRARDFKALLIRTGERLSGLPYRQQGSHPKSLDDELSIYYSAPKAGSVSLVVRLGQSLKEHVQTTLSFGEKPLTERVANEIIDLLSLLDRRELQTLTERIPDTAYRRNFLALSRNLAPDGDDISSVRVVHITNGRPNGVNMSVRRTDIKLSIAKEHPADEFVTITGELKRADAVSDSDSEIGLVDESGDLHRVRVPEGLMADIVRPLWDQLVTVSGLRRGRVIQGEDFQPAGRNPEYGESPVL